MACSSDLEAKWLEEAKESLKTSLQTHIGECGLEPDCPNRDSFVNLQIRREAISAKLSKGPYFFPVKKITMLLEEVDDEAFSQNKAKVDQVFNGLKRFIESSFANDFNEVYWQTSCLISPWYSQEKVYSGNYFMQKGGGRALLNVASSSAPAAARSLSLVLLRRLMQTKESTLILMKEGILQTIERIIKDKEITGLLGYSYDLLYSLKNTEAQRYAIQNGFLECFTRDLKDYLSGKEYSFEMACAIAFNLSFLCSNSSLTVDIVKSGIIHVALDACIMAKQKHKPRERLSVELEGLLEEIEGYVIMQYTVYSSVASLCFRVEERKYLDRIEGRETDTALLQFNADALLKPVNQWLQDNMSAEFAARLSATEFEYDLIHFTVDDYISQLFAVHPVSRRMAAFSLVVIFCFLDAQKVAQRETEGRFGVVRCSRWGKDVQVREISKILMTLIQANPFEKKPPSLKEMCLFTISDNFNSLAERLYRSELPLKFLRQMSQFNHLAGGNEQCLLSTLV
eukprot:m.12654 g.12654  ORF g.12654 m.12654 type:complete len:512 (+) comp24208_c0_seq2:34-1569(+)